MHVNEPFNINRRAFNLDLPRAKDSSPSLPSINDANRNFIIRNVRQTKRGKNGKHVFPKDFFEA